MPRRTYIEERDGFDKLRLVIRAPARERGQHLAGNKAVSHHSIDFLQNATAPFTSRGNLQRIWTLVVGHDGQNHTLVVASRKQAVSRSFALP
jgi:hypothetical protein